MSRIFEALQRLEQECGRLLPGLSSEAQRIFQIGLAEPSATTTVELASERAAGKGAIPTNPLEARLGEVDLAFRLEEIPVENAAITAAARIIYHTDPRSPGADRFRLLRMSLRALLESAKTTLLITSAQAKDGKSTVALNLATALAEQEKGRVLLIEGDLHHPSLAHRIGLPDGAGLAECLESSQNPLSLLRRVEPLGWYFLQAGTPRGNPTEVLQSPTVSDVIGAVRPLFDWILIDSPPVVPLTDTLSLKQYADAGLLVVRADRTPRDAVDAAIARFGTQHPLGIVLNGAEELDRLYSDYQRSYGGNLAQRKGARG